MIYHIGSRHANSQAEYDNVLVNIMFIVIKASFHFQTHDFTAQCQQNQRMWPTALMATEPSVNMSLCNVTLPLLLLRMESICPEAGSAMGLALANVSMGH